MDKCSVSLSCSFTVQGVTPPTPRKKQQQIKQIIFNQCNLLTYLHISGTCCYTI